MSNLALELQGFDVVRVWIRGEANIFADAPSRAPWESLLAKHLPIPDEPIRDLIRKMYRTPEEWEEAVRQRKDKTIGKDVAWEVLVEDRGAPENVVGREPSLTDYAASGQVTPEFTHEGDEESVEESVFDPDANFAAMMFGEKVALTNAIGTAAFHNRTATLRVAINMLPKCEL